MKLTLFAVRRPIAMLMIIGALCLLGGVAYSQLAVKRLPDVSYPRINIQVSYPGGSADNVRTQAIDPIQNAISSIGGIDNITSKSSVGNGRITVRFGSGLDIDRKAAEVAHAIDAMSGSLPEEVQLPTVTKNDPDAAPILNVAVIGKEMDRADLFNLVTDTIQPAIARVPGVADVGLSGGRQPQINVEVRQDSLRQFNVTMSDITSAVSRANQETPGGAVLHDGRQLPVVTAGAVDDVSEFKDLIIGRNAAGRNITLSSVADVSIGYAPIQTESSYNGQTTMGMTVSAQSTANPLDVSDGVRAALDDLRKSLPEAIEIRILGDQTVFTRHALSAVQTDLFIAILIASLVLALFLRRLRQTLIVLCAIPASLLLTGLVMYALDFSLDTISLMALSLLIGILIDDAIVVLENIDRHRRMGKSSADAAVDGRTEIGWAAIAITLTDVVVYAPVSFMTGNVGQLFREFGLVIVCASLFSLVISFTLTPLMAAHGLKREVYPAPKPEGSESSGSEPGPGHASGGPAEEMPLNSRWMGAYAKVQRTFVRHWYISLILLAAGGWFSYSALNNGWVPVTYTPDENPNVFNVQITMPTGTAQEITNRAVVQLAGMIEKMPGVHGVLSTTGIGGGSISGSDKGRITVEMDTGIGNHSTANATAQITLMAATIPGMKVQTSTANPLLADDDGKLRLLLKGPSLQTLGQLANDFIVKLQDVPGVKNIQNTAEGNTPQWSIQPNYQAIGLYNLDTRTVGQAIHSAVQGSTVSQFIPPGSLKGEPVVVRMAGANNLTPAQLLQIPIGRYQNRLINLGQLATVKQIAVPNSEDEDDRQLQITVTANVAATDVPTVVKALQADMKTNPLPAGYSYKLGGSVEAQGKAFKPLLNALNLSVILIYMLLAALYESFLDPLIVILMLPFAATGGIMALYLTGTPYSLYAFIAMIMLMGLVAKNAILLIDYAKQFVDSGMDPEEALLKAGQVRMRPIMMTTVTMVLAMLPLALPYGTGAADRMPIALVLIGGLVLSTLLTLLVMPTFYTYLWRWQSAASRWIRRRRGGKVPGGLPKDQPEGLPGIS
jgi:HAE1 family hydrophobic/amphiphilic exporter-1